MARNFVNVFIPTALDYYREDVGDYPAPFHGLEALWIQPYGVDNWNGPYILPLPLKDPWGREYQYVYPGVNNPHSYDLWSTGRRLESDSDDIKNWNPRSAK